MFRTLELPAATAALNPTHDCDTFIYWAPHPELHTFEATVIPLKTNSFPFPPYFFCPSLHTVVTLSNQLLVEKTVEKMNLRES